MRPEPLDTGRMGALVHRATTAEWHDARTRCDRVAPVEGTVRDADEHNSEHRAACRRARTVTLTHRHRRITGYRTAVTATAAPADTRTARAPAARHRCRERRPPPRPARAAPARAAHAAPRRPAGRGRPELRAPAAPGPDRHPAGRARPPHGDPERAAPRPAPGDPHRRPSRHRSSARHVTLGTPHSEEYRRLAEEMLAEVELSDLDARTDEELHDGDGPPRPLRAAGLAPPPAAAAHRRRLQRRDRPQVP